jgi:hypothetical protein
MERWDPNTDGENGSEKDLWWLIPAILVIFAIIARI